MPVLSEDKFLELVVMGSEWYLVLDLASCLCRASARLFIPAPSNLNRLVIPLYHHEPSLKLVDFDGMILT